MSQVGPHKYRFLLNLSLEDISYKFITDLLCQKLIYFLLFLDKECPLYSQAMSVVMANNSNLPQTPDALTLVQQMREDGLALKK